jgi:glycosyltransferase involved in cell wall biosynthesis
MQMASGKYIALLDSDDVWESNKIERQMQIFTENPQIDFLGTTRNDEYFKKILWKEFHLLTKISAKFLMVKFIFVVPTVIFKSSIINDIGYFDDHQRYAEEGKYFIAIANKYNCYLLNESLVTTGSGKAHFGVSGLSANIKEMEKGELKNLKYAHDSQIINLVEYYALVIFSVLKYSRRLLIVKTLR